VTRLRIGTRGSALALWQSRHVAARLSAASPGLQVELVEISSVGDRITDVPLSHVEGTVDVAVHSYKDLPVESTPGLVVAAVPARAPVEDVLCAAPGMTLATLPPGARVGTCSARRAAQVLRLRPDLVILPLRGNVPTRVARVGRDLDAIVLARAGLVRLGLTGAITQIFDVETMLPAPAQGALAVQVRADDDVSRRSASVLDDLATRRAVDAERTVLHALGGGCSVPVAAAARATLDTLTLTAAVFDLSGQRVVRADGIGSDPARVGESTAARLLAGGAGDILAEFGRQAAAQAATPAGDRA